MEYYRKDCLVRNSKDPKKCVGDVNESFPVGPWSFIKTCLMRVMVVNPTARAKVETLIIVIIIV